MGEYLGGHFRLANDSVVLAPAFRFATQQPPYILGGNCVWPGNNAVTDYIIYCTSYSTLIVFGYYLDNVNSITVSLTLSNGLPAFNVSCFNIAYNVQNNATGLGTYYNISCQLPLLTFQNQLDYGGAALFVQVTNPYGMGAVKYLRLNDTYGPYNSGHVAHMPDTMATITLSIVWLVIALALDADYA